jgi:phosphotransferase system enzyme I (PtsI)
MKEISLQGIAASPGLTMGPAYIWQEEKLEFQRESSNSPTEEYERLESVITKAKSDLEKIKLSLIEDGLVDEAQVFQAHSLMLDDPQLHQLVKSELEKEITLEAAWTDAINALAEQLAAIPDPTFSARSIDLRDVGKRIICLLLGIEQKGRNSLPRPSIVLARDLCPSETASMDKSKVLGFCTIEGGATSHTAILAKSLGIPAVVGVSGGLLEIPSGAQIILDGKTGSVLINPDNNAKASYEKKKNALEKQTSEDKLQAQKRAITLDGHQVEVVANVGSVEDTTQALQLGAEGIGLLRTEFLFLDRKSAPTEEEQYRVYSQILNLMESRPVVVRTIDVGGDKVIPYLDLGEEANPFLGYRAIRMCLDEVDFFKTQLRALLRAGVGHDLRIMFPMVSCLDEVLKAKTIINEIMSELSSEGLSFTDKVQIGIMVEIPSVAILADQFAENVDFFSIGTNDLTQYTLAVDRTNPKVANLGDPCQPAVVRLIHKVIKVAQEAGIWVGICGEMAGDPEAIPLLLGLGLDEFSMSANLIPHAKSVIRSIYLAEAKKLAENVQNMRSADEIRAASRKLLEGE